MNNMLEGIRVIEIGSNVAAPFGGRILADLGADVIKIEKPDGGDDVRRMGPPFHDGDALAFHTMNVNKRSVTADLKDSIGFDSVVNLIAGADVVLHNLRPGIAERIGLGADTLRKRYPRLIHATVTAFGSKGPMAMRPGYDLLMQAYSGFMSATGDEDGPPTRAGPSVVDISTGMWAAIGILGAIVRRDRTGEGSTVECSLYESAVTFTSVYVADYLAAGVQPSRSRDGHPKLSPYQSFPTRNGHLIVAVGNDGLFRRLAQLLGHPEWCDDPRFSSNASRVAHRRVLESLIAPHLADADTDEWERRLDAAAIPFAPVNTIEDVVRSPQTNALGLIVPSGGPGDPRIVALPLLFDGERPSINRPAPAAGQHTDECISRL